MRNNGQHTLWLTLTAAIAILVVPLTWAGQEGDKPRLSPKVTELLKQRLSVLREAAKLHRTAFLGGQGDFLAAIKADQAVLEARIELAQTPAERVEIRSQLLGDARELESAVAKMVTAREATRVMLLEAQAHRLRMEADLLSERAAVPE